MDDEEWTEYKDEYTRLNKTQLMQESRIFGDTKINNKKCTDLLSKVVYLLNQGETFADKDKSEIFFNTTKLFHGNADV